MDILDQQIILCRDELQFYPQGDPDQVALLEELSCSLYERFMARGEMTDLEEALAFAYSAMELYLEGDPERVVSLEVIVNCFHARFTELGIMSDLEEALALERSALEILPQGHPNRALFLEYVVTSLCTRYMRLGGMSDLEEAIALSRSALELCPRGHPNRARILGNMANALHTRFTQLGTVSDLEEALALDRSLLGLRPAGHPDRAHSLSSMASHLHSRFKQLGELSDLEEALALELSAIELRPRGHPDRALSLNNMATYLSSRFRQLGRLSDLEQALALERSALELRPQGHPDRALSLNSIASCLELRFKQLGKWSDLEEALALERGALELRPPGHPHRASSLGNIPEYLHARFKQLGRLSDLEEAIDLGKSALELRPPGHPDRALSLGNIPNYLLSRFQQLGTLSDLDEAIALQRGALELRPQGHPDRSFSLGNLAAYLYTRYKQIGRLSDLEEALALERSALKLMSQQNPSRTLALGNIAGYLHSRFKQLGRISDLEEALVFERSALELRPPGHSDRSLSLSNIAVTLQDRFNQLGKLPDLDESLALGRSALELRPPGHPDRSVSLANIASTLYTRFMQLGKLSDLEEALVIGRSGLALRPQGHPDRGLSLATLARYLYARFKRSATHDINDLHETFNLYSQVSDLSQTVSPADLECAKQWIQRAEECNHGTTVLAYQTFLRLSVHHLATLPSLPENLSLLKQLITYLAVDAFSACLRYGNPTNAIELLEQGRGVFWSQLVRLRSPLDDVIASGDTGKELAQKFTQVASKLRKVLDSPPNADSQHDRAWRLNVQLRDIITDIRRLPGLSRFLQPPLFSDLQVAAAGGPVIIVNASQYGCDALILLSDRDPHHVALPVTKAHVSELSSQLRSLIRLAKSTDVTKEILVFLRQLWDEIVSPIVEILREFCPRRSRIWWCPTAEFSLLPLHAAAPFRKGQPMLSDLYISSYTPTLTALIRARRERLDPLEQHRFLIVGQAQAAGYNALASVNTELSSVSQRVKSVATLTRVQDRDANIANVGEELKKNDFVHLACHGIPDRMHPFESGFALGDGLLNIETIMQYDLRNAKFAYLSACHTTAGDEESPDEVIHLAAAMQFAGFRSVIGTMWAVDDTHANEITSRFYDNIVDESGRMDHTRAAPALHKTIRSVRTSKIPFDQQILYVHIGA